MARAIYTLKMWIFAPWFAEYQKQWLWLSTSQVVKAAVPSKLDEFCGFLMHYFSRAWFSAACSANALRYNLDLYKALMKETNKLIRESGVKVLGCHLWYLFEVKAGLVLFDNELSLEEK